MLRMLVFMDQPGHGFRTGRADTEPPMNQSIWRPFQMRAVGGWLNRPGF